MNKRHKHSRGPVPPPADTFQIGGDPTVRRLGFGAMGLVGPDVYGEPADPANSLAVLRRAVELGVNLIDTAEAHGPEIEIDFGDADVPHLALALQFGKRTDGLFDRH